MHTLTSISLAAAFSACLVAEGTAALAQSRPMQVSKPSISSTTASDTPVAIAAPPGTALYVAKRGDSIPLVARHYLSQTSYLTSTELAQAIRATNIAAHGTFVKPGQQIVIPGILDAPIVEKSVPVARDFEVRVER